MIIFIHVFIHLLYTIPRTGTRLLIPMQHRIFCKLIVMGEPTNVVKLILTHPSDNYVKALMEIDVYLKDVNKNDHKINELIKKNIIRKSEVSVKNIQEEILHRYNIIRDYEMADNLITMETSKKLECSKWPIFKKTQMVKE